MQDHQIIIGQHLSQQADGKQEVRPSLEVKHLRAQVSVQGENILFPLSLDRERKMRFAVVSAKPVRVFPAELGVCSKLIVTWLVFFS